SAEGSVCEQQAEGNVAEQAEGIACEREVEGNVFEMEGSVCEAEGIVCERQVSGRVFEGQVEGNVCERQRVLGKHLGVVRSTKAATDFSATFLSDRSGPLAVSLSRVLLFLREALAGSLLTVLFLAFSRLSLLPDETDSDDELRDREDRRRDGELAESDAEGESLDFAFDDDSDGDDDRFLRVFTTSFFAFPTLLRRGDLDRDGDRDQSLDLLRLAGGFVNRPDFAGIDAIGSAVFRSTILTGDDEVVCVVLTARPLFPSAGLTSFFASFGDGLGDVFTAASFAEAAFLLASSTSFTPLSHRSSKCLPAAINPSLAVSSAFLFSTTTAPVRGVCSEE
ncbi:hypothetical protein HK101_006938, partial [Irineochytrium annulatum]